MPKIDYFSAIINRTLFLLLAAFGLTISPPTISLGNSNNFTFCDGDWITAHPKSKRHATRKPSQADERAVDSPRPVRRCTLSRPRPCCTAAAARPVPCDEPPPPPPRRNSCFPPDQERELAQCRKSLRDQCEKEKRDIEELYRRKLQECERAHRDMEDAMRREHEAKVQAQQLQVDALLIKCNELKGENNLLHIKVAKMMDMLAECAAEVNLQEAELAQVAQTLQNKKRVSPSLCCTDDEQEECDHD